MLRREKSRVRVRMMRFLGEKSSLAEPRTGQIAAPIFSLRGVTFLFYSSKIMSLSWLMIWSKNFQ
jgi:hypothetical protein